MSQATDKTIIIITDGMTVEWCGQQSLAGTSNCVEMASRRFVLAGWRVRVIAVAKDEVGDGGLLSDFRTEVVLHLSVV